MISATIHHRLPAAVHYRELPAYSLFLNEANEVCVKISDKLYRKLDDAATANSYIPIGEWHVMRCRLVSIGVEFL